MIHTLDGWVMSVLSSLMGLAVGFSAWRMITSIPEQMINEWRDEALDFLAQHTNIKMQAGDIQPQTPSTLGRGVGSMVTMVLCAVLSVWAYAVHGWTLIFGLSLVFVWFGVVLGGIDVRVQLLPDRLVLPLGMIGLFANSFGVITHASDASLGAVVGFLVLWGVNALHRLLRGCDGMGLGDAKLLAACGAWLGIHQLPMVVLIAAGLGVLVGLIQQLRTGRSQPFAFGPYLLIGAWLSFLYGERITQGYLALFL